MVSKGQLTQRISRKRRRKLEGNSHDSRVSLQNCLEIEICTTQTYHTPCKTLDGKKFEAIFQLASVCSTADVVLLLYEMHELLQIDRGFLTFSWLKLSLVHLFRSACTDNNYRYSADDTMLCLNSVCSYLWQMAENSKTRLSKCCCCFELRTGVIALCLADIIGGVYGQSAPGGR